MLLASDVTANVTGAGYSVTYNDANALTVGTVNGVVGINAPGGQALTITTGIYG